MAWKHYKRKLWWIPVVVLLAISILALVLCFDSRFGETSFHRIKDGMTESDVEEILGWHAGDYRPVIWKNPTWFVSTTDVAAWPIEKCGMDYNELMKLKE